MESDGQEEYLLDIMAQSVSRSHQQQPPIDYAGEEALAERYQECHNLLHLHS